MADMIVEMMVEVIVEVMVAYIADKTGKVS